MRIKTVLMLTIAAPLVFGIVSSGVVPIQAQAMTAQEVKQARKDASRQLRQARNTLKKAEKQLNRTRKKNGDVEAAQASVDQARSELERAEQAFKDAMAFEAAGESDASQESADTGPRKRKKQQPTPDPEPVQAETPAMENDTEAKEAAEQQRIKEERRKKRRAERRERLREQEAKAKAGGSNEQVEIITESEAVGTELDSEQARQVERLQKKLRQQRRQIKELEQARDSADEEIVRRTRDGRVIIKRDDQLVIRGGNDDDRFLRHARDVQVEDLPRGRTRTTITKPDGTQVITVRNRYGDIIYRVRRNRNGREIVLIDNRNYNRRPSLNLSVELPRLIVPIPRDQYIVDLEQADRQRLRETLIAPPVEQVERVYSLEEVRENERIRDKVRSVNLDNVLFETGSAEISPNQVLALAEIGYAMEEVLIENPDAVFLIEGHTDAVGSELYNIDLSDARARSVAIVLSENFDVPPENLITQGYGEEFLLIPTLGSERRNRRVTVRPITDLIRPEQS